MRARSLGKIALPMVIRIPVGGGIGAVEHHSESNEAYFAHTAGLRVVSVASPQDAYWGIQQAIATDDPVIFYEPKRRYWDKGEVDLDTPTAGLYQAVVAREGTDCTVAAYGPMVKTCLQAAQAAADEGRSLEVVDLRSLAPLDLDTLCTSVQKTGRLVVVHEASVTGGVARDRGRRHAALLLLARGPVLRWAGTTCPTRPAGWRRSSSPTSTACSTASTAPWRSERAGRDMAVKEFRLPDPGEGLTEAEVVTWHVAVGDTVKVNDIVVEIERRSRSSSCRALRRHGHTRCSSPRARTVEVGTPIIGIDDGVGGAAPAAPAESPATVADEPATQRPRSPAWSARRAEARGPGRRGRRRRGASRRARSAGRRPPVAPPSSSATASSRPRPYDAPAAA